VNAIGVVPFTATWNDTSIPSRARRRTVADIMATSMRLAVARYARCGGALMQTDAQDVTSAISAPPTAVKVMARLDSETIAQRLPSGLSVIGSRRVVLERPTILAQVRWVALHDLWVELAGKTPVRVSAPAEA
jgi:hypothetical protein